MESVISFDYGEHTFAQDMKDTADAIKFKALDLGFDLVGITHARPSAYREYFSDWLAANKNGSMKYLADRFDERTDPGTYFPGAASAVCVAVNYHVPLEPADEFEPVGRIAKYALGGDYHQIIKDRLHDLADWIRVTYPGCQTRSSVDTAPVMEKELAVRAGVGWMGKNTCVIHPRVGSFILLGQVLTTLELSIDEPITDHCGSCTRCLDACPTQAFIAPFQLDASRCLSYLTIEHRGELPEEFSHRTDDWIFGCDVCQTVCPFNRKAPTTDDIDFQPRIPTGTVPIAEVVKWTDEEYRNFFRRSAVKRVKLEQMKRNASSIS